MKKIVIILIVLILCGCKSTESKLEELGYSQADIEIIETYSDDIKDKFLSEYNEDYVTLIHSDNFDIDRLDNYIKYFDKFDIDELIKLGNLNLLNDEYVGKLLSIRNSDYYISNNEELYLEYFDNYDSVRDLIEAINTHRYCEYYTDIKPTDISKDYLMLVNKYNALASDYEPDDLVDIDSYYGKGRTRSAVYEAYKKMADDAFELGYSFRICSAYRAYDYQYGLYNKYLNEDAGGQASVDTYSARPGHSEHQSGLCLDLADAVYGMDDFGKSEASTWINENCYKYGFIIRYTKEKENITGYQAEPWQVRYVGDSVIAKDIMGKGISFDEYYAYYIENE